MLQFKIFAANVKSLVGLLEVLCFYIVLSVNFKTRMPKNDVNVKFKNCEPKEVEW